MSELKNELKKNKIVNNFMKKILDEDTYNDIITYDFVELAIWQLENILHLAYTNNINLNKGELKDRIIEVSREKVSNFNSDGELNIFLFNRYDIKNKLGIQTLQTRNSDSLDFIEVYMPLLEDIIEKILKDKDGKLTGNNK